MHSFLIAALLASAPLQHQPLTSVPRGAPVIVTASIPDASRLFTPQVFVRVRGSRFHGYPMEQREGSEFAVRLPGAVLRGAQFEYFIEARLKDDSVARAGSAQAPFAVTIEGEPAPRAPAAAQTGPRKPGALPSMPEPDLRTPTGPARLSVRSEPPGAKVLLDGKPVGVTPFSADQEPGPHAVALELEGRERQERSVKLEPGGATELEIALPAIPHAGILTLESKPSGATVVLDGVERGTTPFVARVPVGLHQVVVRMAGRREVATEVPMPAESNYRLHLVLPPQGAEAGPPRITVSSSPDGATVSIDDHEIGITPWLGVVAEGAHKVSVALPGFKPQERTVHATPEREVDAGFVLERLPAQAKVHVETDPPAAMVAIDGRLLGRSPLDADVAPGDHEVRAEADGYRSIGEQVTLLPGQPFTLRLALVQRAAAAAAPLVSVITDPAGADLYIDEHLAGPTPIKVNVAPGKHALRLSLTGHGGRNATFTVPDRRDYELRIFIPMKPSQVEDSHEAPDTDALVRAQVARAHRCFQQGDFPCAIAAYKAAFELKQLPELLFNIASARRRNKDYAEAAEGYRAFVRAAPGSALRGQAERLAALCESFARTHRSAPTEDDVTPPAIEHLPVSHAQRGKPLLVSAKIRDDKSGVASPLLCLRNAVKREYECKPLGKQEGDAYAIELPAASVIEGLAYYIEAYDNSSNGPARSGSPELPHAVAVDDETFAGSAAPRGDARRAGTGAGGAAGALAASPAVSAGPPRWTPWAGAGAAVVAAGAGTALALHMQNRSGTGALREASAANALLGAGAGFAVGAAAFALWNQRPPQSASMGRRAALGFGGAAIAALAGGVALQLAARHQADVAAPGAEGDPYRARSLRQAGGGNALFGAAAVLAGAAAFSTRF